MTGADHALRLARIDVTRSVRRYTDSSEGIGTVVSALAFVLLVGGVTVGGGYAASRLGESIAAGSLGVDPTDGVRAVRGILGVFALVLIVVVAVRAVGARGTLPNAEGTLTMVTTDVALFGHLLSEYVYVMLWLLPPGVGLGVGLAIGTGTVQTAVAVPATVALVGLAVVAVGFPLGLGVKHVATRFPVVARHKTSLVALVFVAYFVAIVSGSVDRAIVAAFEPLMASPIGWYADLALLGTPGLSADPQRAIGAVVVSGVVAAAGSLVAVRIAGIHWFSDPALAGERTPATTAVPERGVERHLIGPLGRPTAALVGLAWRRAVRSPFKLLYAAYPLLFMTGVAADIVQTGRVPSYLPYALLVFVAWGAGVVFTLNPLGDQGSVLPTTLLSEVTGRRFVGAHVFAGLAVSMPVAVALTAVAGVLSPLDVETVAALVAATPVVMVVASGLSVGIGTAFPRFEATSVTRSMKAVLPSWWAFFLFSLHLFLTALATATALEPVVRQTLSVLVSVALPFGYSISPSTLRWVAGSLLVPLLIAPAASYRYAVRRFDAYAAD